jgi:uncharacterized protein YcbX
MSNPVAIVSQLYIYPVKAMRGVLLHKAFLGINGFYGDRRYAFARKRLVGSNGFPWTSGRLKPRFLLYAPRLMVQPLPDYDPETRSFGSTPVLVRTPSGEEYELHDPRLCEELTREQGEPLLLMESHRGVYDSQQLSLFSLTTLQQLEHESHSPIEHRQFRANLYFQPHTPIPFAEETWTSRVIKIGPEACVGITEKNERCVVVNLDPETAVQNPRVLRALVQGHKQEAGLYANVLRPGWITTGDPIEFV